MTTTTPERATNDRSPAATAAGPVTVVGTPVPDPDAPPASLKDLVGTASRDLSMLVRKEIELAKAELTVTVKGVVKGVAPLLGALVFVLGASLLLCFTIAEAWARLLGRPLGFLVGAVTLLILAAIAGFVGKVLLGKIQKPERTPVTVKDDIAWAKNPTKPAPLSSTGVSF